MHHRRALARAGVLAGVAACVLTGASPASAQLSDVNTQRLRNAVTVNGILSHERVFQRIANRNRRHHARVRHVRATTSRPRTWPGDWSDAGYDVTTQEFTFPFFRNLADPTVTVGDARRTRRRRSSTPASGNVTGAIVPAINNQIPATPVELHRRLRAPATSPPAPAEPAIALVQRGTLRLSRSRPRTRRRPATRP